MGVDDQYSGSRPPVSHLALTPERWPSNGPKVCRNAAHSPSFSHFSCRLSSEVGLIVSRWQKRHSGWKPINTGTISTYYFNYANSKCLILTARVKTAELWDDRAARCLFQLLHHRFFWSSVNNTGKSIFVYLVFKLKYGSVLFLWVVNIVMEKQKWWASALLSCLSCLISVHHGSRTYFILLTTYYICVTFIFFIFVYVLFSTNK